MAASASQPWPLSQTAKKAKGICSVCHNIWKLHQSDGMVYRHGHRDDPCLGSNRPPLSVVATQAHIDSASTDAVSTQSTSITVLIPGLAQTAPAHSYAHPCFQGSLFKHIPRGARPAIANLLTELIDLIARDPANEDNWDTLLSFGAHTMLPPGRGGKRHNLPHIIKERVETFRSNIAAGSPFLNLANGSGSTVNRKIKWLEANNIAWAVSSKLEEGNIRAAVRILCSNESPVPADSESLEELLKMHPPPMDMSEPPLPPSNSLAFQTTEGDVMRMVRSFPAGSAGGPDGIRPQHMLDLITCKEVGITLLSSLTILMNIMLAGNCPDRITSLLFGGTLFAL